MPKSSKRRTLLKPGVRKNDKKATALPKREWALYAYIAGDNNLSDAGLEDIIEMCVPGTSSDSYCAVQIDTYGEFTGAVRYEIGEPDSTGECHRKVIERIPEPDTGDPRTFTKFVEWARNRYPAQHELLVVWNHGSGFRVRGRKRDIAFDDYGTSLDMSELDFALERAGIGTGQGKNRLAILGFDACLMSMLEIAEHLGSRAEYVVGSQQLEPGDGWPYDKVLEKLNAKPKPTHLARAIVDAYYEDYLERGEQNVTQSAVDLSKTGAAMKAFGAFGAALAAKGASMHQVMKKVRLQVQCFDKYPDYVDAIDLARLTAASVVDSAISDACKAFEDATAACVAHSKALGSSVAKANGLSVWFPMDRTLYLSARNKYTALRGVGSSFGWLDFLDDYLG